MIDSESLFFAITGVGPLEGESAFEFSSFPLFFREPMIVKPLDRIKHGGVVDENRSRLQLPPLASVVERCARSKLRRPDSGMVSPVTDHRVKLP
jgi:hypothetical protein